MPIATKVLWSEVGMGARAKLAPSFSAVILRQRLVSGLRS